MEKTRCPNHPSQFISNFCANDTCLVELCATCICQHTEYHHKHLNTLPKYENIKNTLLFTNQRLSFQKEQLTEAKTHIKNIMDQIINKKKQIQNLIKATKQDVMDSIEKVFCEMEREILNQLEVEKQKTGLHREQQLEKLYLQVNKKSVQIYQKAQELNSFKYPQMIRQINSGMIENNQRFLLEITKKIQQNQLFKMDVLYQPNALKQIISGVKKIITTSFSYPSRKNEYILVKDGNKGGCPYKNMRVPLREKSLMKNEGCPLRNKSYMSPGAQRKQRSPFNKPQPTQHYRTQQNWFCQKERGTPKFHQTYGL